jgi:hypothetical protein
MLYSYKLTLFRLLLNHLHLNNVVVVRLTTINITEIPSGDLSLLARVPKRI